MGWISSITNRPGLSDDERRLRKLHFLITLVALPVLVVALAVALAQRDVGRAGAVAVLVGVLTSTSFWLARVDDGRWVYRLNLGAFMSHAMAGDRERCIDVGMNGYLAKPFDLAALEQLLERWCRRGAEKKDD